MCNIPHCLCFGYKWYLNKQDDNWLSGEVFITFHSNWMYDLWFSYFVGQFDYTTELWSVIFLSLMVTCCGTMACSLHDPTRLDLYRRFAKAIADCLVESFFQRLESLPAQQSLPFPIHSFRGLPTCMPTMLAKLRPFINSDLFYQDSARLITDVWFKATYPFNHDVCFESQITNVNVMYAALSSLGKLMSVANGARWDVWFFPQKLLSLVIWAHVVRGIVSKYRIISGLVNRTYCPFVFPV